MHVSDEGTIFRIYKELQQIKTKREANLKKWEQRLHEIRYMIGQ